MTEMACSSADAANGVTASPGALMKAARQAQGLHIEALAVALKVPVNKLEALERDRYDALPDAVFVRALASSVCRCLKLDPAPVLALMPQGGVPSLARGTAGINAVFRDGTERRRSGVLMLRAAHPVFLAVFALLVGAAGILAFFPHAALEQAEERSGQGSDLPPPPSAPAVEAEPSTPAPPSVPARSNEGAQPGPAAMRQSPASVTGSVPSAALLTAETGGESGADVLVFHARSDSWIQVRDAAGATTLQRVIAAGERISAPGEPPFAVVVGKADATEVFVRGKAMDLVSVSRDNVARFEVKR